MEVIKNVYLDSWEEFVALFDNYSPDNKDFIFRGQTNFSSADKFCEWKLISSFNRSQTRDSYSFNTYLYQHFEGELFKIIYGEYKYQELQSIKDVSVLERCYFFQHHGVNTCFLDFTFDPLIALYFAITSLPGRSGGKYDSDGIPQYYESSPSKNYISIFQININLFRKYVQPQLINKDTFRGFDYDTYEIQVDPCMIGSIVLGLDLCPELALSHSSYNHNLLAQKSAFLLFDNEGFSLNLSFDEFVQKFFESRLITPEMPIITVYKINYNSVFKRMKSRNPDYIPLFNYLNQRQKTGKYLFTDIQGLKNDFNFFHQS